MGSFGDLVKELRRRRVFREAAVYIVVGWLLIQVLQTGFESRASPSRISAWCGSGSCSASRSWPCSTGSLTPRPLPTHRMGRLRVCAMHQEMHSCHITTKLTSRNRAQRNCGQVDRLVRFSTFIVTYNPTLSRMNAWHLTQAGMELQILRTLSSFRLVGLAIL
jgi:hypothetical protein